MDHRERLAWAHRHLDALDKSIESFRESQPYHVRTHPYPDRDGNHFRGVLVIKREPPVVEWGLMAGDVLHSLRSSLDNLAYALESAYSGRPEDKRKLNVQFPIFDDFGEFTDRSPKMIGRTGPDAQKAIEALQPYHRLNPHDPTWHDWLTVLRDASNVDKHRRLLLGVNYGSDTTISLGGITNLTGHAGPFVDGAVIASFDIPGLPPELVPNPKYGLTLEVRFPYGWPTWGWDITSHLKAACDLIENNIFAKLEPYL